MLCWSLAIDNITTGVGMDIVPGQAPATDDQELAKVLESMNSNLTTSPAAALIAPDESTDIAPVDDSAYSAVPPTVVAPVRAPEPVSAPLLSDAPAPSPLVAAPSGDLESIKKAALTELRPLVDKLNLSPEDTFDTLLLIIRSTDDKTLVSQAHEAAKLIEDDTRRAEALLDVIKEIDYFSQPQS